jgi:NADPH:quinone reductase
MPPNGGVLMPSMKAVQIHRFGAEDVLQYEDIPIPSPDPWEILIKVQATSVNHADLLIRQQGNIHIGLSDLPLILGRELAGIISEVGPNVHEYRPGQRVVAIPSVQTRPAGLPGGKEFSGCYAEYALARPQDTRLLPDDIDTVIGAATGWVSLTAWYALKAAQLKEGERVLIHSGGSGLGVAAIQFAKYLGADVFATAGTSEKCARLLELGADAAINYQQDDFEAEISKRTKGQGVDIVIETVGGQVYVKSLNVLAPGGRLMALGSLSGGATALVQKPSLGRTASRFSITALLMRDPHALEQLDKIFELIRSDRFRVIVDRAFPLADVALAHRYIAERRNFGKVAITI